MSTILDLEAWLASAAVHDQHEARALHAAVMGVQAVGGFECVAHQGTASWLVSSPHSEDTLVLGTPIHREALLGMLRQRHDLDKPASANKLPSSKITSWRLPPHVSALAKERAAAGLTQLA